MPGIGLTDYIYPFNESFTGIVQAKEVLGGGADGTLPVACIADNSVVAGKLTATATDVLFGRVTAGAGAGEEIACTDVGRALLDDITVGDQRTTLGLGTMATETATDYVAKSLFDANYTMLYADVTNTPAGLEIGQYELVGRRNLGIQAIGKGDMLDTADGVNTHALGWNVAAMGTYLLGTMSSQNASAVAITGGNATGLTTLAVGDADDTTTPSEYVGVGASQDGMLFCVSDVVYLDGRTSNVSDVHLRNNDAGTRKTLVWLNADTAMLTLGYATESDLIIGVDAQTSVTEVRPSVTEKVDLGNDTGPYRFNEVHFVTLKPKTTQTYTVTDPSTDRALDVDSDTTAQVAAVLGTLIADLQTLGILS